MKRDIDLDRILKDLSLPEDKSNSKDDSTDDFFDNLEKEKNVRRDSQRARDNAKVKELDSLLATLESIDAKIKHITGATQADKEALIALFFERIPILCKILMSGASIPEATAEKHYFELKTIYKTILEKQPQVATQLKDLQADIDLSYAFYYKSQSQIYSSQFQNALEDSDAFFRTTEASNLAAKTIASAEKALSLYEYLGDLGMVSVKIGKGYEVYDKTIISSSSADNKIVNVRISARAYAIYSILELLVRYTTALRKFDQAKEFNAKLEKLNIGFQVKPETYSESYQAKLNKLYSDHGADPNSLLASEIDSWHKYWEREATSPTEGRGTEKSGLPDFVKLILTALVVLVVLAFFASLF